MRDLIKDWSGVMHRASAAVRDKCWGLCNNGRKSCMGQLSSFDILQADGL